MLDNLYFGKDDAESDMARGGLLAAGFLQTKAYESARSGKKVLILGRKGSGKSAICLILERELRKEGRVSLVNPDEISADEVRRFELAGIQEDQSKRLIWRYVFAVQIAKFLLRYSQGRLDGNERASHAVGQVRQFLVDNNEVDDLSIVEKFWRVVDKLRGKVALQAFGASASLEMTNQPQGILADQQLQRLEQKLNDAAVALKVTETSRPFYILVDQIERLWSNDRNSDAMVVALLQAAKEVRNIFQFVICTVFLRTDIYEALNFPERDKFRGDEFHITWDSVKLIDLVEARARVSTGQKYENGDLWKKVFPAKIGDTKSSTFLVSRTLQRPRDLIQLCNACRDLAYCNGGRAITTRDVHKAISQYSSWKLSDLQQEWNVNYPFLADVLLLLSNSSYIVKREKFEERLNAIKHDLEKRYPILEGKINSDFLLDILFSISAIGVVRQGSTLYGCHSRAETRIDGVDRQFVIHPCFRNALQSTSALELAPFEVSDAADQNRIRRLFYREKLRDPYLSVVRGKRSTRLRSYLLDTIQSARSAVSKQKMADDICDEIRVSLDNIRDEFEVIEEAGDEIMTLEALLRAEKHISKMQLRLIEGDWISQNSELLYRLRDLSGEMAKFIESGAIREYRA
ncbi:MAG: hypothetical protein P9C36_15755 [Defluviicoccus sp.]|nr:hypothetical protein [Defluviicoccus sp.]MDG4594075.1 hypothetical protein [Defluviicoccus sp.]